MRRIATVLGLIGLAALLGAEASAQVTFIVNSTADAVDANPGDGICATNVAACTLRAAIMEANALPSNDRVNLPSGVYQLTLGELNVSAGDLVIAGAGRDRTTITGDGAHSVITFTPSDHYRTLELSGLRITNGNATGSGGGIYASPTSPTLHLHDCRVDHNRAQGEGGGISLNETAPGHLIVERCLISDNSAGSYGGGISVFTGGSTVTIQDSEISSNEASYGGGLFAAEMNLLVSNSSVTHNTAVSFGGGIEAVNPGGIVIVNSTFSDNAAAGGGAISIGDENLSSVSIVNSTIVDNTATAGGGGGIAHNYNVYYLTPTPHLIENTIIARNTASGDGPDCAGSPPSPPLPAVVLASGGHNIVGDGTSCFFQATPSDFVGTAASPIDPGIAPLADNGGPTLTHALLPNSPAINAVPVADCVYDDDQNPNTPDVPVATDQRGVHRPQGVACDIGAYEFAPACNDGIDNDGDGLVDYPADPGCSSALDDSEKSPLLPCDDGIDNDGDGLVDYRVDGTGDPGCFSPGVGSIENPACQDGKDNDGDGKIDFDGGASANHGVALGLRDPDCGTPYRTYETVTPPCGLGAELSLVLPLLMLLRGRRQSKLAI
jgi:CSLREA domain-containing protein